MIEAEHRGQGYATEAAQSLFDFASSRDDVRLVVAHTLPDGFGFRYIGETVDPEDGTVSRFERAAGSQAGAK
jgi:hypothetical protein